MSNNTRVLILEDEIIIAWDIEAELKSRGITVCGVAGTAADALGLLEKIPVDVALLDINLATETSFEVARICRARGIEVMFLTGDSSTQRPEDLRDCPVIEKPVIFDQLITGLARISPSPDAP